VPSGRRASSMSSPVLSRSSGGVSACKGLDLALADRFPPAEHPRSIHEIESGALCGVLPATNKIDNAAYPSDASEPPSSAEPCLPKPVERGRVSSRERALLPVESDHFFRTGLRHRTQLLHLCLPCEQPPDAPPFYINAHPFQMAEVISRTLGSAGQVRQRCHRVASTCATA
jgi:hypothetical protein